METSLKSFWEKINSGYSKAWQTEAKIMLSNKELKFIEKYLKLSSAKNILDVGIGTGRILEFYLQQKNINEIYGVDISNKMVAFCQDKFKDKKNKIKFLKQFDISKQKSDELKLNKNMDFISAIRVLQYNKNWKEIIGKLSIELKPGGILLFSLPNKHSINAFYKPPIESFKTTSKELKQAVNSYPNLELIEMKTFTRLPDRIYDLSSGKLFAKIIDLKERFLSLIFGKVFLGRIIFVAVRKKV